ncbi:molybdate ABC transporter substrate-binding protein [Saccharobesus litoralis]|uniref:Molybdate ABC transporter substrate-binding protein n=1 Tax=Saccharobesus litoralis TaxID=2172099 RepID=A0A2S0VLT0_9ALTE|nr:molybdate ABC transporter substrate-binding protein [Saccharobesus litoralis]AWB65166.1 molybdate ABC transporter substrate-binding protein [Saccharobesus litoralis]
MRFIAIKLFTILLYVVNWPTFAENARIVVASNFSPVMQQLVERFEQQHIGRLQVTYTSSGKAYAQIIHGAPFDVFLSADQHKPKLLQDKNLAVQTSLYTYATGRLVLWSTRLPNNQAKQALLSNSYNKLALANAKLAPYGVATLEVLKSLNLLEQSQTKWVQGENIGQTLQFVRSGNADVGFVAYSQVINLNIDKMQYWLVPTDYHNPIQQDLVLLKRGATNPVAKAFIAFIKSEAIVKLISQNGYIAEY